MPSFLLSSICAGIFILFYLMARFFNLAHDPQEPPLIPSKIPFIGHIVGMLRYGSGYYSKIAKEYNQQIFTLGLPRAKMYIVTSPDLITACDRRARVVSFAPYVVDFGKRILLASQHGIDLLSEDLLEENGPVSLRPETMKAMHHSLMPGETLEEITQAVLKNVSRFLDSELSIDNEKGVLLFQWVREFVSIASTNVIYGREKNPLQNPEVMKGFWGVDRNFALLSLMVLPNLVAPEASRGRRRVFDAFREYYTTGGLKTASHLVKARYEVNSKHGVSEDDIAHFDLGVCTALLVNTVPAIYWTLCHVFSNPDLVAELRRGIEAEKFKRDHTPDGLTTTVNIQQVIKAIPLIESLVKEVLRVQSNNSSARFLLKDTLIKNASGTTYLLKKGSFLAMPSAPIHSNEAVWGLTANTFDPTRFLKLPNHRVSSSSYRTFGGGNALCPGRHLAMHEIMGILIIMVLRYDIVPLEGRWRLPATRSHISTSILTPMKDIRVKIKTRENIRGNRWNFIWEAEGHENGE